MKTIIHPEILLDEDGNIQEDCLVRLKMGKHSIAFWGV